MRERPILMSAPMIRAILAGTKTQTRRIITPQQPKPSTMEPYELELTERDGSITAYTRGQFIAKCRHGQVGDRLWVKEAIRKEEPADLNREDGTPIVYSKFIADGAWTRADAWPWKNKALPGMFMPRGLSRITLEVTGIRVERLHEITEADARAEGCTGYPGAVDATPREEFEELWKDINGLDSWRANPWVWVVEFKRLEAAERAA